MQVCGVLSIGNQAAAPARRALIERHIGILYAFGYSMRRTSRLPVGGRWRIFGTRRRIDAATLLAEPSVFQPYLSPEEYQAAQAARIPWSYLLSRQATAIRTLLDNGLISETSHQLLNQTLADLLRTMGQCDRIKNTPFPRQLSHFGRIFTWTFVLLVPLALLDALVHEARVHELTGLAAREFIMTLMSLSQVIGWVFIMMERIGESTEDPFEGGVHDVPIATVCRGVEIELRELLGDPVPAAPQPIDDVLY
jgi:putative membrane protein